MGASRESVLTRTDTVVLESEKSDGQRERGFSSGAIRNGKRREYSNRGGIRDGDRGE
ncbi:hypothetical protein PSPO01_16548 [Paraphaeosphaeria sporulosa]